MKMTAIVAVKTAIVAVKTARAAKVVTAQTTRTAKMAAVVKIAKVVRLAIVEITDATAVPPKVRAVGLESFPSKLRGRAAPLFIRRRFLIIYGKNYHRP